MANSRDSVGWSANNSIPGIHVIMITINVKVVSLCSISITDNCWIIHNTNISVCCNSVQASPD